MTLTSRPLMKKSRSAVRSSLTNSLVQLSSISSAQDPGSVRTGVRTTDGFSGSSSASVRNKPTTQTNTVGLYTEIFRFKAKQIGY